MKLNEFQKTKDGDFVRPYLVEGKTVYCHNKNGDIIIKKLTDFYKRLDNSFPVVSVERNTDVIIPENVIIEDGSFFDENIKDEEPVMNIAIEPAVKEIETEKPVEKKTRKKKEPKVIVTEDDPYADYF